MSVQMMWSYTCGDRKGDGLPLPRPVPQLHMPSSDGLTDQTPKVNNPKVSPASAIKDPGFSADEWDRMLKLVHWGGPDRQITTANLSTSPDHSAFVINDLKGSYYVGEELHVTIVAKDFTKTPKSYGGDFFQAKVYSDKLKVILFIYLASMQFSSFHYIVLFSFHRSVNGLITA